MRSFALAWLAFTLVVVTQTESRGVEGGLRSNHRRLNGLIYQGAPGTYVGDPEDVHGHTITNGIVVGHLVNGTAVLDSEAFGGIAEEVSFLESLQHMKTDLSATSPPREEENILMVLLGGFLGGFIAVAVFLVFVYFLMRKHLRARRRKATEFSSAMTAGSNDSISSIDMDDQAGLEEREGYEEENAAYWDDGHNPRLSWQGKKMIVLV